MFVREFADTWQRRGRKRGKQTTLDRQCHLLEYSVEMHLEEEVSRDVKYVSLRILSLFKDYQRRDDENILKSKGEQADLLSSSIPHFFQIPFISVLQVLDERNLSSLVKICSLCENCDLRPFPLFFHFYCVDISFLPFTCFCLLITDILLLSPSFVHCRKRQRKERSEWHLKDISNQYSSKMSGKATC